MFAFHIVGLIAAVAAAASAAPAQVSSSGSLTWAVPGTAPVATPISYTEPVRQNATGSIGPSVTLYRRDKSTPSEAPAIYFSSGSLTWAVPATAPVFTPPSYTEPVRRNATGSIVPSVTLYKRDAAPVPPPASPAPVDEAAEAPSSAPAPVPPPASPAPVREAAAAPSSPPAPVSPPASPAPVDEAAEAPSSAPAPVPPPASPAPVREAAAAPSSPPAPVSPPASPAPVDEAAAAPSSDAAPPVTPDAGLPKPAGKFVANLKCTDFTAGGGLNMDGKPVSVNDAQLVVGGQAVPLTFLECNSSVMGLESHGKLHYGLLSPKGQEKKQCIRPAFLAKPDQHLQVQGCSLTDDSSQLAQIFEYNEETKGIQFAGRVAPGKFYVVGQDDKFVTVSPNGESKKLSLN